MRPHSLPLLALTLVLAAVPAAAINGHFLHGIGAPNSAMGGAGVALPMGAMGSIYTNPALLTQLEGHYFDFSVESVDGKSTVESRVETPFGLLAGSTEDVPDKDAIPAFAWAFHRDGSPFAFGMGFLGIAGFKTDYPQDSSNPILLPQPLGFGRTFTDYRLLTIPFTVAYQVNPQLSVGAALNAGVASLSASPFPITPPDCSSPTECFFPTAQENTANGAGFRLGLFYQASPKVHFGFAYTSPQWFESFEWNSAVANPNLPTFGLDRQFEFNIDTPQMATVGVGLHPTPNLSVAIDAKWINYADADGFGDFGFSPEGAALGLGWDDILIGMVGIEYRYSSRLTFRGGINIGESPVSDEVSFANVGSPGVIEENLALGVGFRLYQNLRLDLTVYRGFENEVTGPFLSPFGPVPGTRVTNSLEQNSMVLTISFGGLS